MPHSLGFIAARQIYACKITNKLSHTQILGENIDSDENDNENLNLNSAPRFARGDITYNP
jgi:hypothetical protein